MAPAGEALDGFLADTVEYLRKTEPVLVLLMENRMPPQILSLNDAVKTANERLAALPQIVERLVRNVEELNTVTSMVENFSTEIKDHTNKVRSLLSGTNGAPADVIPETPAVAKGDVDATGS